MVACKRFQIKGFDLETFGILQTWWLRRGGRNRGFDCSSTMRTCYSVRAFHKYVARNFLIGYPPLTSCSQKVARKRSEVAFCNESCSKSAQKNNLKNDDLTARLTAPMTCPSGGGGGGILPLKQNIVIHGSNGPI